MPSPSGPPTFVYGVGAVGYQSCPACGAKWRYVWQEQETAKRRSRRPFAVAGALVLIGGIGAAAVLGLRGSSEKFSASTTTVSSPAAVTAASDPAVDEAAGAQFVRIFGPSNLARAEFMKWLVSSARVTPQIDVNQHVADFVRSGREAGDALARVTWPQPAAAGIVKLRRACRVFLDDVDLLRSGFLYSPSFFDQLRKESQAVKDAASAVRQELGLSPAA